jgi:hypothetical protein
MLCRSISQARAFTRETDMRVAALEKGYAQFIFQFGNLVAHGALGHIQGLACRRETHFLSYSAEDVETVK